MSEKVVVISGAAGRIGFEICQTFCESGMRIAIFGSTRAKALETARRLGDSGGSCLPLECNVADSTAVRIAMQKTVEKFGGIDILVSMQGWPPKQQDIAEITDEYWNGVISSHLTGSFHMLQQAVPYLEKSAAPRVIFMASNGVFHGDAEDGLAYSAAKGGIVSLTYAAAKMLARRRITVNCIAAGGLHNTYGLDQGDVAPDQRELLKNLKTLSELRKAVSFLTSEAGGSVTGKILIFSGSRPVSNGNR